MTQILLLHQAEDSATIDQLKTRLTEQSYRVFLFDAYHALPAPLPHISTLVIYIDDALLARNFSEKVRASHRLYPRVLVMLERRELYDDNDVRSLITQLPDVRLCFPDTLIESLPPATTTRRLRKVSIQQDAQSERSRFIDLLLYHRDKMQPMLNNVEFIEQVNQRVGDSQLELTESNYYNYFIRPDRNQLLPLVWLFAIIDIFRTTVADFTREDAFHFIEVAGLNLQSEPIIKLGVSLIFPAQGNWDYFSDSHNFIGREQEQTEIIQRLNKLGTSVYLIGVSGIGKSSLATHIASTMRNDFEGIFYFDTRMGGNLDALLTLISTDDTPLTLRQQVSQLLQILSERRLLLIIDHCENLLDTGRETYDQEYHHYPMLFKALATSRHRSSILIISHLMLPDIETLQEDHDTVQIMVLKGMIPADIRKIFRNNDVEIDQNFAVQIHQESSGHPALVHAILQEYKINATVRRHALPSRLRDLTAYLENLYTHFDRSTKIVVLWLTVFREWVPLSTLRTSVTRSQPGLNLRDALHRLEQTLLIERHNHEVRLIQFALDHFTLHFVDLCESEIINEEFDVFSTCSILNIKAPEYILFEQKRHFIEPLRTRLVLHMGDTGASRHLQDLLKSPQAARPTYFAANLLHLLIAMRAVENLDAEDIYLANADLRTHLHSTNFTGVTFDECVFYNHHSAILNIVLHPHEPLLAMSTTDGWVHLWEISPRYEERWSRRDDHSWISGLSFSDRGELFSHRVSGEIVRWDIDTGQPTPIGLTYAVDGILKITVQGDYIAVGGKGADAFILWDMQQQKNVWTLARADHSGWCYGIAFDRDGQRIALSYEYGVIQVRQIETGEVLNQFTTDLQIIRAIQFSKDGSMLICGGGDGDILWIDLSTGDIHHTLEHHSNPLSIDVSPDNRYLASGDGHGYIRIWDLEKRATISSIPAHSGWVRSLRFVNENILVSGATDRALKFWDFKQGRLIFQSVGQTFGLKRLALSPDDSKLVISGEHPAIYLHDLNQTDNEYRLKTTSENWARAVAFSPTGNQIAVSDEEDALIYDLQSRDVRHTLQGHTEFISSMVYTPSGQYVFTTGEDCSLRKWNAQNGIISITKLQAHQRWIWKLQILSDGQHLVTTCAGGLMKLWNLSLDQLDEVDAHSAAIWGLAVHPHSNLIATSCSHLKDGVCLWDIQDGRIIKRETIKTSHDLEIEALAFSPDGRYLAVGSFDQTLSVWDLETITRRQTLTGHRDKIYDVVWGTSGLFSASVDGTIRQWEPLTSDQPVAIIQPRRPYEALRISETSQLPQGMVYQLTQMGAILNTSY